MGVPGSSASSFTMLRISGSGKAILVSRCKDVGEALGLAPAVLFIGNRDFIGVTMGLIEVGFRLSDGVPPIKTKSQVSVRNHEATSNRPRVLRFIRRCRNPSKLRPGFGRKEIRIGLFSLLEKLLFLFSLDTS